MPAAKSRSAMEDRRVDYDGNPRDLINFIAISERIPPGTVRSVRRMTLGKPYWGMAPNRE
jgi:hypothetical protein